MPARRKSPVATKPPAVPPDSCRLWYSPPLGGWVFRDKGAPGRHFTVRIEPLVSRPHVLAVFAHYLALPGAVGSKTKRIALDGSVTELFRVDAGNGFLALNKEGLVTGVIEELRDIGFIGGGRIDGAWREYLTER